MTPARRMAAALVAAVIAAPPPVAAAKPEFRLTIKAPLAVARRVLIDTLRAGGYTITKESRSEPPSPRRLFMVTGVKGAGPAGLCAMDLKGNGPETELMAYCGNVAMPKAMAGALKKVQHAAPAYKEAVSPLLGADQPHVEEADSRWVPVGDE